MKIIIEIPSEYERQFREDRFNNSLLRLCNDAHCIPGNHEIELAKMLHEALQNATEIIQCKDCEYYIKDGILYCRLCNMQTSEVNFCGYAWKREETTE